MFHRSQATKEFDSEDGEPEDQLNLGTYSDNQPPISNGFGDHIEKCETFEDNPLSLF